jgi:outer membrane protein TolC
MLALFTIGCSTTQYKDRADKEVYRAIDQKTTQVPGMTEDVDIEPKDDISLDGFPVNRERFEFLKGSEDSVVGARVVNLEKALELAFKHNRDYQTQKERLYLQALSLTLDRYQYTPIFNGSVDANHNWTSSEEFTSAATALTGTPATLFQRYADTVERSGIMQPRGAAGSVDVVSERSVDAQTSVGMGVLLKSGGQIAIGLTSNFLRFLTGDSRESASSALIGSFRQPIMRGAGSKVAAETLMQAERDLLYQLRIFTRFRKEFAVRVASQYYAILRNKDIVRNNFSGLQSITLNLNREKAFEKEGMRTPGEVGRLEQNALSREASLANSIAAYQRSLDNFKILLGLSTDTAIVLDDMELEAIVRRGIVDPGITQDEAIDLALATRLDLYTERDRVDDAQRKIFVAANGLKADLDLVFSGFVPSKDGNRVSSLDWQRSEWSAGVELDLPLSRKAERNTFRRTLIDFELAGRSYDLLGDQIKLQIRDAWRSLETARIDYEINELSVALSERRVEEETLKGELGLGDIINQVDAQDALTASQSARTAALVRYTTALLEFWRDIGVLYIKDSGQWEDIIDV